LSSIVVRAVLPRHRALAEFRRQDPEGKRKLRERIAHRERKLVEERAARKRAPS
jgi:hypothetical protein